MNTVQKLESAESKIRWFIRNKSTAAYALSELAEAAKLVGEVQQRIQDTLPQVADLLDGKAEVKYPSRSVPDANESKI